MPFFGKFLIVAAWADGASGRSERAARAGGASGRRERAAWAGGARGWREVMERVAREGAAKCERVTQGFRRWIIYEDSGDSIAKKIIAK